MNHPYEVSVIIPIYNSAEIFPHLYERLTKTLSACTQTYEIIAVVDGCRDNSAEVVAQFCAQDSHLKLIELSRNFGEQAAISAGMQNAGGELIVMMDDDLEDPPEVIPQFLAKANEGYDVVYGIIKKRHTSAIRKFFYFAFYRVLNFLIDVQFPNDAGSFAVMRHNVISALNEMPENNRYLRGMRSWVGFRQVGLEYERHERYSGESGYNLRKYFRFALTAILSFSYKPLDFVTWLGFLFAGLSFFWIVRLIIRKSLLHVDDPAGWTSLMVMITFLGGVQLMSVGVLGQYIARIYDEVKKRPPYLIKRKIGISSENAKQQG